MGEKLKCMGAYQTDREFRARKPTKIIKNGNGVECEYLGNKDYCLWYKRPSGMDLFAGILVGVGPLDLPHPKSLIRCIHLNPSKTSQKG